MWIEGADKRNLINLDNPSSRIWIEHNDLKIYSSPENGEGDWAVCCDSINALLILFLGTEQECFEFYNNVKSYLNVIGGSKPYVKPTRIEGYSVPC